MNEVSKINITDRFLVTQHAAFDYWIKQYNFTGRSLEGISTQNTAGLREIDGLAKYLKENHVKVIFLESTVPPDQIQAVIEATEALDWQVKVGGTLLDGSLNDKGQSTYMDMLLYDTKTIVSSILNPPAGAGAIARDITIVQVVGWSAVILLIVIVLYRRNSKFKFTSHKMGDKR